MCANWCTTYSQVPNLEHIPERGRWHVASDLLGPEIQVLDVGKALESTVSELCNFRRAHEV